MFDQRRLFQGISGGFAHALCFQPTLHPDEAAFWLPDFGKFHGAATARAGERIVTETGFDALAPFQRYDRL